jgi:hypothetical protein
MEGSSPSDFKVVPVDNSSAFDAYFDTCVACHQPEVLGRFLRRYRRFVFAAQMPVGSWEGIDHHLAL